MFWKQFVFAFSVLAILVSGFMLTDSYSQLGNQESYSVQTGSYPSNCPPQISTGDSCSYIVVQLKHNGNLTINDLTSSFSGNLTLFNEDYSGIQSSYYFTPVQGLPYHYTYHDNNSADFGIIENRTISNLNLGFYSAGTYYLLILGNFPNGFINDISLRTKIHCDFIESIPDSHARFYRETNIVCIIDSPCFRQGY